MNKLAASFVVLCVLIGSALRSGDARSTMACTSCKLKGDCDREPNEFCMWGEVRDNCHYRVCAKGPGDRCGGPMEIYGKCAEGLMCTSDEKCHGCKDNDASPWGYECFNPY